MKSYAELSLKSKLIAAIKIQLTTSTDVFLQFGSIRRLNRIYHPEIINGQDLSKVEKLISRAYRSSRGTLDELVENLPKNINRLFLELFVNNGFLNLEVSAEIETLKSDGVYVVPFLVPDELVQELRLLIDSGVATPKSDTNFPKTAGKPDASASTWWFDLPAIIANRAVQSILRTS